MGDYVLATEILFRRHRAFDNHFVRGLGDIEQSICPTFHDHALGLVDFAVGPLVVEYSDVPSDIIAIVA
jgi:hypothetical protein